MSKSFTEEDVVIVARAFDPNGDLDPANLADARTALAALAEAGRLVPDGADRSEEWQVRILWPGEEDDPGYSFARDEAHARTLAEQNWPTARKTLIHRTVIAGPWVEADGTD